MNIFFRSASFAACALFTSLAAFGAEPAPGTPMSLASPDLISLADAMKMAQAAMQECTKRNQPTTVVIMDSTGFQRVALSDDKAKFIGVVHTRRKADTVLNFKESSAETQKRAETDKQFADQYGKDERYLLQGGGLPIYRAGKLVAVISVGGSGNENDACAQAGVKAVSWASIQPK